MTKLQQSTTQESDQILKGWIGTNILLLYQAKITKMIKNKKGTTSFASGLSILEILLEIFVVLSVIFLISGSLLKNLDSRDSQSIIIALTPLYSTAGMSYYDEDLT